METCEGRAREEKGWSSRRQKVLQAARSRLFQGPFAPEMKQIEGGYYSGRAAGNLPITLAEA